MEQKLCQDFQCLFNLYSGLERHSFRYYFILFVISFASSPPRVGTTAKPIASLSCVRVRGAVLKIVFKNGT